MALFAFFFDHDYYISLQFNVNGLSGKYNR